MALVLPEGGGWILLMTAYTSWFIPLCIGVSFIFAVTVVILTIAILAFRARVTKKYDRGNLSG
ncbi:hypothetical protein [Paenibacillus lentus]|uniref:Uncharacterized protein n=1 Tax=Paenibacillus lentus TaxID=1338368 RepID=A0A3S8RRZ3_9BACL|nr:hypothetical protein [Paenibacillus lentus]AZK45751.1 hypothetical protein EIM92_05630 [Paenibacillus lentus]